ncbi:MAG TPA: ATP-binding cassette domain-containing protein [Polyangiaceae bacterium]|nr:ATP-binding cassette domain-containing protein [Polyangiaceae bacterium]
MLRKVSLNVPEGCLYGLIGPGASGKSLLLKMITALMRPDEGRVVVGGEDVGAMTDLDLARFRLRFGMLFQNNALFDAMTVADNVAFPLRREGKLGEIEILERVAERLAAVSLGDFGGRIPSGLSGGQKKRVGVARATITRAPIIFYDEPAAGLDPVTSQRIFDLLRAEQTRAKTTVIMVSSDIERLLTVTDRVGMMHRGELIFDGTTEEAKTCDDPYVKQFIHGLTEGPL